MKGRTPRALVLAAALATACGGRARAPEATGDPRAACPTLDAKACLEARGLLAAAPTYEDEAHAYLLPARAIAPGRGVVRSPRGERVLGAVCAAIGARKPELDLAAIDYAFVGVAIDATLISADGNVAPLLGDEGHTLRLVAIALVHDRGAASIGPGPALRGCACNGATDVAGEARYGALVAYEVSAPRVDAPTRAIDLARDALADPRAKVRVSRAGKMSIEGLTPYLAGRAAKPLAFRVTEAAPVAYALRPLAEACAGALLAPDVAPSPLDFGVAPYGKEALRSVRVTNRASIDLDALVGPRVVRLPARGAIDLPLAWTPDGDAWTCETQTRDEAIRFVPSDRGARVAPAEQLARVLETIRTGRPSIARSEPVVPGPDDKQGAPLARDWSCMPDFVPTSCRIDRASTRDVAAEPTPGGCHFSCRGRNGGPCRFDATMECRLRCPE